MTIMQIGYVDMVIGQPEELNEWLDAMVASFPWLTIKHLSVRTGKNGNEHIMLVWAEEAV